MAHEKLRETYEAWRAASDDYFKRIQRIISGDATANDGMPEVIATMKATYEAFMKEGETIRTGRR